MSKICTTIEQSKKLIELGLDVKNSDMFYVTDTSKEVCVGYFNPFIGNIPAWSLSALLRLMPSDFIVEGELGTFTYKIHIRKYRLTEDTDVYQIAYGNYGSSGSWHDMINTGEYEELLDAVFEMICYLLEQKLI